MRVAGLPTTLIECGVGAGYSAGLGRGSRPAMDRPVQPRPCTETELLATFTNRHYELADSLTDADQ